MKKKFGFISALFLTFTMSFSVSANQELAKKFLPKDIFAKPTTIQMPNLEEDILNPVPEEEIKVDNDLLYLYNNNVYKNDFYKFNITLDSNWQKPTYNQSHTFAFAENKAQITFISGDVKTNPNAAVLGVILEKLPADTALLGLDVMTEMTKTGIKELAALTTDAKVSDISATKKSTLSEVPFNYFTFDTTVSGITVKTYMYMGLKGDSMYIIAIGNVNKANKTIVSKALKSIVIK